MAAARSACRHRFYAREGELFVEFFPDGAGVIHSKVLDGFQVPVADFAV